MGFAVLKSGFGQSEYKLWCCFADPDFHDLGIEDASLLAMDVQTTLDAMGFGNSIWQCKVSTDAACVLVIYLSSHWQDEISERIAHWMRQYTGATIAKAGWAFTSNSEVLGIYQ